MAWYHTIDWVACGAFAAAAVALYGAWRANKIAEKNLSLSAELEIIKFREKWLQELRTEFSCFISLLQNNKFSQTSFSDYELGKIESHRVKILLLMNPDDAEYELLNVTMKSELGVYKHKNIPAPNINPDNIVSLSQRILRTEWNRLKTDLKEYNNAKNK